ncbi:MAG TPA: small ribosomal subunit Rsm22 family protein [Polyangiaceae bacterium]|jgi:SAM-dependent methyltransferase|nr:small ribosomal subunit Rsm22 family protein [Polyangiaceae bacterium]
MNGLALVRPLEEDWRDALDGVARSRGWPSSRDPAKLAARVVELSAAYNDPARARAAMREAGAARLGFSFARDVPKAAAAVRELLAAGALPFDRPLRVLDLGAGLGASTWGLARALKAAGATAGLDVTWVDNDGEALDLGAAILRARAGGADAVEIRLRARAASLASASALGRFDVVLLGQVLSELDVGSPGEARLARHVELIRSLLRDRCADEGPGGAVVVIEPALRERARHLHRVRDALAATGVPVFAPCLHSDACPALAREGDWCHEDLEVDLPAWLWPVARAAGLRREGLSFSYLVLHRAGRRLVDALASPSAPGPARLRVVSEEIRTKGKREAFVCGECASPAGPVAARARLMRLDRDANAGNAAWEELKRGDLVLVTPPPERERPRIGSASTVEKAIIVSTGAGGAESR